MSIGNDTKPMWGGEVMFPSRWLKAEDLKGQPWDLTIKAVLGNQEVAMKGGKKEKHYVIQFYQTDKEMILKPTNAGLIAEATGISQAKDWPDKVITVYPTTCHSPKGPNTPCIRVRNHAPSSAKSTPAPTVTPSEGPAQEHEQPFDNNGVDQEAFEAWNEKHPGPNRELFKTNPTEH